MTLTSGIDVNDPGAGRSDVVLGEDWVQPEAVAETELRATRSRRSLISLNRSPLARKIITFNLLAMIVLVAGVLYLNPFRETLVLQRENALVVEARLTSNIFEAQLPDGLPVNLASGDGINVEKTLSALDLRPGVELFVFDPRGNLVAYRVGPEGDDRLPEAPPNTSTVITDFLNSIWDAAAGLLTLSDSSLQLSTEDQARSLVLSALRDGPQVSINRDVDGNLIFSAANVIAQNNRPIGVVALATAAGEIDQLVRVEREQVLQMFVVAILVSIGLSLVLASTIANPLRDLAAAAELGQDKNARKVAPSRVRIPDLTARPDEIGRLSGAMRGMVGALYERIDANEQFAADVAHEIKNPLASLRSAIGTLRVAKKDEQRAKLLDVIEHDVRRLDRLVSDISNASRLDSELVKEEEEPFDVLKTLRNLSEYLSQEATTKGIDFITDLPSQPIFILGLEARLAQVFVNLITNAISFCEDGDAVRVWARCRENRVLIVIEDTGPGIPQEALTKIFNRFYSERPERQFGDHSGLGLAISKQIVEAHSGVIWAENIRPTDADLMSDPLGARFVVGLPV
ncbi:MAG: sensor histidine kinase [Pseudomonadota bacterium]